jgi:hypothetical protein
MKSMKMLKIPLQIFRYREGESPHYDIFTVQVAETAHVIDAMDTVWRRTIAVSPFAVRVTIPHAVRVLFGSIESKSCPASPG